MNPRRWYIYASGAVAVLAVIAGATFIWRNRNAVRESIHVSSNRVRGTARSVWGKVEQAASKLTHTERDPQEQA